jgi:hypothetical protein
VATCLQSDSRRPTHDASKFFHERWRTSSAITLADTDGNDGTPNIAFDLVGVSLAAGITGRYTSMTSDDGKDPARADRRGVHLRISAVDGEALMARRAVDRDEQGQAISASSSLDCRRCATFEPLLPSDGDVIEYVSRLGASFG